MDRLNYLITAIVLLSFIGVAGATASEEVTQAAKNVQSSVQTTYFAILAIGSIIAGAITYFLLPLILPGTKQNAWMYALIIAILGLILSYIVVYILIPASVSSLTGVSTD